MKIQEIKDIIAANLGIKQLNDMQNTMLSAYGKGNNDIILLSPTGSGKTIAFTSSVLLQNISGGTSPQIFIIAPSRELVIQIVGVIRKFATPYKVTECYGGHKMIDEENSLAAGCNIVVSTPGRLLDHINRGDVDMKRCRQLVLDEFDKILELGFETEMKKIMSKVPASSRIILTSATDIAVLPDFIKLKSPETLSFINEEAKQQINVEINEVQSAEKDKLPALYDLLASVTHNARAIVFVNYRDAVKRVYDFLKSKKLPVGLYMGSMDQIEREKAIELFNNGTFKIIVSTDLASRGLDIVDVEYIIHYHMPLSKEAFIHRNGRAGRQNKSGKAFVLRHESEPLPDYVKVDAQYVPESDSKCGIKADSDTLFFHAGRKEKISKGDVVGFITANTRMPATQIGVINSHDHYTLVAVPKGKGSGILRQLEGKKIKNQKVRVSLATQKLTEL